MGDRALSRRGFLAASAAAGLGMTALSACGGGSDGGSSDGTTTIEWWNISTTEPTKTVWAGLAKKFQAQNPKIKIKIVQLENDAYKSKMTALTASGKLPDIFHTWGGGVLQQQVDAGTADPIVDLLREVGAALCKREAARGGVSLPLPEQEVDIDGDTWSLQFRRMLPVEE